MNGFEGDKTENPVSFRHSKVLRRPSGSFRYVPQSTTDVPLPDCGFATASAKSGVLRSPGNRRICAESASCDRAALLLAIRFLGISLGILPSEKKIRF